METQLHYGSSQILYQVDVIHPARPVTFGVAIQLCQFRALDEAQLLRLVALSGFNHEIPP